MNINRLFELAGLPNNDILLEAAYDNMVTAIKQKFPEQSAMIDDNIKKAKTILKKQDRMVWYIKVLRAYLLNDINAVKGDYNFSTIEQFNDDLFHYYGLNINEVDNVEYKNQNISELFQKLNELATKYQKSDKAPVPVQHGDYELIHFPDGSGWWFIDRAFCEEEGRSGKHCGNVVGQHETDQRILSLRTPNHNVILTFILLENGYLGEMKAKANQKPSEQYHPQIMQLLLNPMVKGIESAGYAPYMNFSIFDLSEHNIEVLINHGKKSFIANQIKAEPIEFLKAPSYIKNNPEYQQVAIKALPALNHLIGKDNDLDAWENAIDEEESLIIYAPHTLTNFTKLVTLHLRFSPSDILKSPKNVATDFNILKSVLELNGISIKYIIPSTPKYNELCKIAVTQHSNALQYIPEEFRTFEICKIAVSDDGDSISYVPEKFRTFELCKIAVEQSGYSLRFIMSYQTLTYDEQLELCKIAVSNDIKWIRLVPDHLKDKVKQELNIQESLDFKYFQNL
jgi:hypothetical protein